MTSRTPTIRFITIYPDIIRSYLAYGVMKAAADGKQHAPQSTAHASAPNPALRFEVVNLRDFAEDKHGTVDGKPYGGIDGMVLRADVLARAVATHPGDLIISTSPKASQYFNQVEVEWLKDQLAHQDMCLICGRFGGLDARFEQRYLHKLYSFGDFVTAGGELPCLIIAESIARLMPTVIGNPISCTEDSFGRGRLDYLEYPLYTKPRIFENISVPEELLSGDHQLIANWKKRFSTAKPPRSSHQH